MRANQESEMITATFEDQTLERLLNDEIEPFLEHLRAARYADETVHRKRAIAREFAQWAQQHLIVADNLNSNTAAEFVTRLPERAKTRVALERATVRLFLEHLHTRGRLQHPGRRRPNQAATVTCADTRSICAKIAD